jgi:hypothetical protein
MVKCGSDVWRLVTEVQVIAEPEDAEHHVIREGMDAGR